MGHTYQVHTLVLVTFEIVVADAIAVPDALMPFVGTLLPEETRQFSKRLRLVPEAEVTLAESDVAAALRLSVYGPLPLPVKLDNVVPPARFEPLRLMPALRPDPDVMVHETICERLRVVPEVTL